MLKAICLIFFQRLFLAVLLAWCLAQGLKLIISVIEERKVKWRRFLEPGGMPSSHAAVVVALLVGVGIKEGIGTTIFIITLVFASVTIYEAIGVRREVGEQAKLLNEIFQNLPSQRLLSYRLKEQLGHKPVEALIGGIIGLFAALLLL